MWLVQLTHLVIGAFSITHNTGLSVLVRRFSCVLSLTQGSAHDDWIALSWQFKPASDPMSQSTNPKCAGSDGSQFRKPPDGKSCKAGEMCTLGWNGHNTYNDRNYMATWRAYLVDTDYASNQRNITIFDSKKFTYGDAGWGNGDACGNTQMEYNWTIPANLTSTAANFRYILVKASASVYGKYESTTTEVLPSTSTGSLFLIMPITETTMTMTPVSSSPTTSTAAGATLTPDDRPDPVPVSGSLSTGAIAGIAAGASLGAIFLAVGVFLWTRRRSRRNAKVSAAAESQERYDKAELDSGTREKNKQQQHAIEADGGPFSELTMGTFQKQAASQEPAELPGGGRGF
ncbi:hypothetical protein PGQ11_005497 [Apiospora arundinis]|uniref:Uncharacterized protein n=1 Tax=Apiospora arundinis TaxID=335852 RepID=A0ABR2JBL8_9PEZI